MFLEEGVLLVAINRNVPVVPVDPDMTGGYPDAGQGVVSPAVGVHDVPLQGDHPLDQALVRVLGRGVDDHVAAPEVPAPHPPAVDPDPVGADPAVPPALVLGPGREVRVEGGLHGLAVDAGRVADTVAEGLLQHVHEG